MRNFLKARSLVLWVIVLGVMSGVLWASFYRIDEITKGTATVIASSRIQYIQAVDGGVLEKLLVKEGDRVESGQVLATLDTIRFQASYNELSARVAALKAQIVRLRAEITGSADLVFPAELSSFTEIIAVQRALFRQRKKSLEEELSTLQIAVDLANEDAVLVRQLGKEGDVSRSELIRVERALNDARAQYVNRKNKFFQEVSAELAKLEDDLAQNQEVKVQREKILQDSAFRAAVPGIVKNVRFTTPGAVLRGGEELMQIVPVDDELLLEAKIRPVDIAHVKTGLFANIKFDPFDHTIYGAVNGQVVYVSPDTIKEEGKNADLTYYRVHVVIPGNPVTTQIGRKLDILPGMTAQVDIRTGKRTVMDYLLKPLKKTLSDSLGER